MAFLSVLNFLRFVEECRSNRKEKRGKGEIVNNNCLVIRIFM